MCRRGTTRPYGAVTTTVADQARAAAAWSMFMPLRQADALVQPTVNQVFMPAA